MREVQHPVTMAVATDPMQSEVMGWLDGELGYKK
jgi:hypothetical protein